MRYPFTRDSFLNPVFCVTLMFLGNTSNAISADVDGLLSKSVASRSAPSDPSSKSAGNLQIGEIVKVKKIVGDSALIQSAKHTGWIPSDHIVGIDTFRPVREWKGPKTIAVGEGDYSATYTLNGDGTFSVTESEPTTNKIFRTITRSGHLHASRTFILAKRSDVNLNSRQIFVRTENGKLCWQPYMDGRCGISP